MDRAGYPTSYLYDGLGRLTRTTFADGTFTENQYDAGGRLFATLQGAHGDGMVPGPQPLETHYEYDAAGRRTGVINALNQTNRYAYDASGNQTNFVDALGRTNSYTFDRLNRQTRITYPDNTSESYGYDALDHKVAVTNQAKVVARFGFDKLGQLIAVTNGFGSGTVNWATYAYDQVGNQTNQVDALKRQTRFEYDVMGRRVRTVLPGNQSEGFAYNALGNVSRYTNFNSVVITNQYDALNRLTNKASIGGYNIAFAYTAMSQRATMSDSSGNYSYTYNSRNQLLTQTGPAGTLTYIYDNFGRLDSITSSHVGGASMTYDYDSLNRLSNVVDTVVGTTTYGYDEVGNLQTVRFPNAVTNSYTYDALNRLTNLTARTSSGTLASFAYKLAATGNRTNLTDNVGGTSRTFNWAYDPLYRLTNEVVTGASPTGTISYKYDAVGNRTNRTSTVAGLANQSSTYNTNDWLTTDVYDNNGSTRTNGANVFFYDVGNHLTNATVGGVSVSYTYNGDGLRVSKTTGGVTTLYLVDDRNPSGYAQVLEELTASGGVTNVSKVFTYGHDLIAQRTVSSGVKNFYGYDGNGNTRYLTANDSTISDTYIYDAFGTLLVSTGSTANNYLYTGEQYDSSLGLYYLRARYLNTGTGRFWTKDNFPGRREDPASLHKYLYCADNPANSVDPSGRVSLGGTITVGGIFGGLAGSLTPAINTAQVWAFARIATIAVAISATLAGDENQNAKRNTMRLQLQEGIVSHYWSQVITAPQNPGITRKQVQLNLAGLFTALQLKEQIENDWDSFNFSRWETQLWSAIIRMSSRLNKFGPVSQTGTVLQEYLNPTDPKSPRIDLENLRGVNLRQ